MSSDEPVPDTALATGNDEGTPSERLADPPLQADEAQLLSELREPGTSVVDPVEQSPDYATAVEDEAPLPTDGSGGAQADGLAPDFREP